MANKETRDVGMRQYTVTNFRLDDPNDASAARRAFDDLIKSLPTGQEGDCGHDALRRENVRRCREILATVDLSDSGSCVADTQVLRDLGLEQNTAQWIAAHWLASYHAMMRARDLVSGGDTSPQNLARMIDAAEELGRWQERLWWRAGIDKESGERREELAVIRKRQKITGREKRAMKPDTSFKAVYGAAAQVYADDLHSRKPELSWNDIKRAVATKYGVSTDTVKKALVNPKPKKKAG